MSEYTGQLRGGPDEGNLISATTPEVRYEVTYRSWPDGPNTLPVSYTVWGFYVWAPSQGVFVWRLGPLDEPAVPPAKNEPTGDAFRAPWRGIPAGWFVQGPSGAWYEVLATRATHSGLQLVTIQDMANGKVDTRRPIGDEVLCRRGTLTRERDEALSLFGEDTSILEDQA